MRRLPAPSEDSITLPAKPTVTVTLNPPGEPAPGNDWVLVLDDAARSFRPPGKP